MDRGPSSIGKIVDDARRTANDATGLDVGLGYGDVAHAGDEPGHISAADDAPGTDMPVNLGDELAFDALYAHMKALSMFDWSPDGMVLSEARVGRRATPSGSAELDAREAMLFNIAVQGPAIAKTWTGDASKMRRRCRWTRSSSALRRHCVEDGGAAPTPTWPRSRRADHGLWQSFAGSPARLSRGEDGDGKGPQNAAIAAAEAALPTPTKRMRRRSCATPAVARGVRTAFEERETASPTGRLVGASGAEVRRGSRSAILWQGGPASNLQVATPDADADMKNR